MVIGILTFYCSTNYGALLQARALNDFLIGRGHRVRFIRHPRTHQERFSFWRCFLHRRHDGYWRITKRKIQDWLNFSISTFAKSLNETEFCCDVDSAACAVSGFDALIAGSDQIWNPHWIVPDFLRLVFLDFAPRGCKRISYAASFAVTDWGMQAASEASELLNKFDAISVRENSGAEIVRRMCGREASVVLDPTLLHARHYYEMFAAIRCQNQGDYIFTYLINGWGGGGGEDVFLKLCCDVLRIHTMKSETYHRLGFNLRVRVSRWLQRIRDSAFVITNSFHGVVFAILFERPFVAIRLQGEKSAMNVRIESLLSQLGLENRICNVGDNAKQTERILRQTIDWRAVSDRLQIERERSIGFIERIGL